jgi:hypothetical protein
VDLLLRLVTLPCSMLSALERDLRSLAGLLGEARSLQAGLRSGLPLEGDDWWVRP